MIKFLLLFIFPLATYSQAKQDFSIDKFMQAQYAVKQFSGAVLIIKSDKVVFEKAFGFADLEWKIPNTIDTRFRIGSITKQFTAACILKLEEQGKLHLDDKLSKYVPGFPKADSVTIHMLLTHSSGIVDYVGLDEFWNTNAYLELPPDSFISVFRNMPYDFAPGTKSSYSNSGYFLLGMIIEKVSGESYSSFLSKNIVTPAGLSNTGLDRSDTILPSRAKGYSKRGNTYYNAGYININAAWSAGAVYSSAKDLYKWSKALYSNHVIGAAGVKKMTTGHINSMDKETFGYGLMIDSVKQHPRIWHNGGIPGFTSYMSYYPLKNIYIIVISNNSFSSTALGHALSYGMLNMPVELPYVHKEIKLADTLSGKFIGKYEGTFPFEIIRKNDKLYIKRTDGRETLLKPESETRLFYADDSDRQLYFTLNKDKSISKVYLISSGISTEIKKIQ
ncbi:MAG: beta-lactamase family protein [Gemmatimonadaceae bacterium]|nr:beta-lactamase family protein [Chitinophagaceae bacterium]